MHRDGNLPRKQRAIEEPTQETPSQKLSHIVVIGGGAAGFFFAINAAILHPHIKITLLEKTNQMLAKVRISGGGRCNVTHACFDPQKLVLNYPRGSKELLSPFFRFQPQDTIRWFEERGVHLKTEADGRMFPTTDSSSTIIDTLLNETKERGIGIKLQTKIESVTKENDQFIILTNKESIICDRLVLATGSLSGGHLLAKSFGHTIQDPVPSLFTFNIPDSPLKELSGISLPQVELKVLSFVQKGPFLVTHWGFSGPAVLKLSAFAARALHECDYKTDLFINWVPGIDALQALINLKSKSGTKNIGTENPFELPRQLWKKLVEKAGIDPEKRLSTVPHHDLAKLGEKLKRDCYQIDGKTTYKEEFVTCGGVSLKEVNFKKMESKLSPGLFFAGEVLDIDGVTGGFNFQNAWTTAWIAANSLV